MPGSPNLADQLAMLRAELDRLAALVDAAPERPAIAGGPRNPRWAVTCKEDAEATYPAEVDTPNTYWIKFTDSSFTATEGDQTPTDTERQTEGAALAHYRDITPYQYLPEGTDVLVCFDHGQWWIVFAAVGNQASWIEFVVNDAAGYGVANSSVTVDGVIYHDGYTPATPVTTVYNVREHAAGTYIFYGDDDDHGIALLDRLDGKYYIVQMECP